MDASPIDAGGTPPEVRNAFRIYVAHVCVTAVALVLPVLFTPPILRIAEQQMIRMGTPPGSAHFAMVLSTGILALVGLLVLGLEFVLARRMRAGGNTARIVLTVLSCGWAVLFAFRSDQVVSQLSAGPALMVGAVLQIGGVVLLMAAGSFLFRPAVSRWFRNA